MTDASLLGSSAPPKYEDVPGDFPRPEIASAVSGFQNKLALVKFEGRFYTPGGTPPELHDSWMQCEEHANRLAELCIKNEHGKYAHMTRTEILDMYSLRLLNAETGFSAGEDRWKIRRAAALLGWPVPPVALSLSLSNEVSS